MPNFQIYQEHETNPDVLCKDMPLASLEEYKDDLELLVQLKDELSYDLIGVDCNDIRYNNISDKYTHIEKLIDECVYRDGLSYV